MAQLNIQEISCNNILKSIKEKALTTVEHKSVSHINRCFGSINLPYIFPFNNRKKKLPAYPDHMNTASPENTFPKASIPAHVHTQNHGFIYRPISIYIGKIISGTKAPDMISIL